MKSLIVDAGNSRIACVAWDGDGQLPVLSAGDGTELAPPVPLRELGDLSHPSAPGGEAAFLESFQERHRKAGAPRVVLISVIPRIVELLADQAGLVVVDHNSVLPFTHDVADISRVGPDRLCNMAAAVSAGLADALVVDAGTATTFDILLDGVFVGGMIAPGMAFAARQIGEVAARLDPVPFGPATWDVGRDTESAMGAGAWHAGRGGVQVVVSGLKGRYGEIPVVVTGGLGSYLDIPGSYFDAHWTLRGGAILSAG
ncbi:MAG: type III pantothenate kinase [Candidatus Krumholzibacteriota bacterium]